METGRMRIGILGGTFDPIHNGHLQLARAALVIGNLHKVLFLVSKMPPHKSARVSAQERYEMVELALENEPQMEACDIEIHREGKSYTANSLMLLRDHFPDAELFYIIGSDVLPSLPYWYKSEQIFSEVDFLCFRRKGLDGPLEAQIFGFTPEWKRKVHIIDVPIPDISSKKIREALKLDLPCQDIPTAVARYIQSAALYS